jgi:hypothetical protein
MRAKIFLLALLLTILTTGQACADWFIYNKPAFEGQILDGDTKEPIEGAVVVVLYNKRTIGLGAGTLSSAINIRETLTDKEGHFRIPPFTTLIQPFSWEDNANFIIYKPGYVGIDYGYDRDLESFFAGEKVSFQGQKFEWHHDKGLVIRYRPPNIVELPKAMTMHARLRAIPGRSPTVRARAVILNNLIEEEEKKHELLKK